MILIAYLATAFFILPFSEEIFRFLAKFTNAFPQSTAFLVKAALGAFGGVLIAYVLMGRKPYKIPRLIALGLIAWMSISVIRGIESPFDRLHVIEYGLLSFLLFRILRFYVATTAIYLWVCLLVLVAAIIDESVQLFLPNRSFSLYDMWLDIVVAVLAQLTIALVIFPKLERWKIKISRLKKDLALQEKWVDRYNQNKR